MQQLRMGRHSEMVGGDQIGALAAIRGVTDVEGRLWGYFYDASSGPATPSMPSDRRSCPSWRGAGGRGCSGRAAPGRAPLFLSRYTGDMVKLRSPGPLPPTALVSSDLVLLNERFPRLLQLPEGVWTDLALSIRNPLEIATIVEKRRG
ncbi:MAG: hypothetical protein R3D59_11645 [Paracoccaceae bacterium]